LANPCIAAKANAQEDRFPAPHRFEPTEIGPQTSLGMDLRDGSVRTVIWATGYCPDYSWLDVPVLDRKGASVTMVASWRRLG
jgi:putative flavoprotein involved in K+ transport